LACLSAWHEILRATNRRKIIIRHLHADYATPASQRLVLQLQTRIVTMLAECRTYDPVITLIMAIVGIATAKAQRFKASKWVAQFASDIQACGAHVRRHWMVAMFMIMRVLMAVVVSVIMAGVVIVIITVTLIMPT